MINHFKAFIFLFAYILGVSINVNVKAADTTLVEVINFNYSINTIAGDSTGTIWLSGKKGLQYYDYKKETFITTEPSYKNEIIADNGAIVKFTPKSTLKFYPWHDFKVWLSHIPGDNERVSVARDKFNRYWVCSGTQIFIFSIENRFNQILDGYSTRGIFQDGENLYVNTYELGILKNGKSLFKSPAFAQGEIKKFGESIYFAWDGVIRYEPLTGKRKTIKFEKNNRKVHKFPWPEKIETLHQINDTIWAGTTMGLGYIENDSLILITAYPNVQDLVPYNEGLLIAGNKLSIPPILSDSTYFRDCEGMYIWKNKLLTKLALPELNYSQILQHHSKYYLASDSGIVIWDGANNISWITEDDGLSDNRTCTMAIDEQGFLWVSTFSGLNRINLNDLKINTYLNNIEFNYRSVFQNDSLIFMGGLQGIYIFNPKDFIGDDIIEQPKLNSRQLIILISIGLTLLIVILFFIIKLSYHRKLIEKDAKIREEKKKNFLMSVEQVFFTTDMTLTVKTLAEVMKVSERSLYRNFKNYEITPGAFLKELRLRKARYLLENSRNVLTIKDVASIVGYTEQYLDRLLKGND